MLKGVSFFVSEPLMQNDYVDCADFSEPGFGGIFGWAGFFI